MVGQRPTGWAPSVLRTMVNMLTNLAMTCHTYRAARATLSCAEHTVKAGGGSREVCVCVCGYARAMRDGKSVTPTATVRVVRAFWRFREEVKVSNDDERWCPEIESCWRKLSSSSARITLRACLHEGPLCEKHLIREHTIDGSTVALG